MLMLRAICLALAVSVPLTCLAKPAEYRLDSDASTLQWTGEKVTGAHHGTLKISEGTVLFDGDALTGGSFVLDMNSINNLDLTSPKDKAKLEGHLKSEDFFNVPKFPTARFEISKVTPVKVTNGEGEYQIEGNLTVKSLTRPVKFPATVKREGEKLTAKSSFKLNRTEWDIRFNSGKFFDIKQLGDKLIYDDIAIELSLLTK